MHCGNSFAPLFLPGCFLLDVVWRNHDLYSAIVKVFYNGFHHFIWPLDGVCVGVHLQLYINVFGIFGCRSHNICLLDNSVHFRDQ